MASFGANPADRAVRHLRAARDYLAAGDAARARAAADRAVDNDPYDLDAVDLASGFAIEQGDVDASAAMLTRLLTAKDDRPPSAARPPRRAVARARPRAGQRGDVRQAVAGLRARDHLRARRRRRDRGAPRPRRAIPRDRRFRRGARRFATHLQLITRRPARWSTSCVGRRARRQGAADAGRATLELALACGTPPTSTSARSSRSTRPT